MQFAWICTVLAKLAACIGEIGSGHNGEPGNDSKSFLIWVSCHFLPLIFSLQAVCFGQNNSWVQGCASGIVLNPGLLQMILVKSGTICKGVRWAGCYSGLELWAEVLETDWIQWQEVEALIHCVDSGWAESRSQGEETNVISDWGYKD